MSWARLDDGFPQNPKVIGLSDAAFRAYVEGICYATRHLTDGMVPRASVREPDAATELVRAGLWNTERRGWQVHDWHDWNPTAERIKQQRKDAAERMRRRRRGGDGTFTEGGDGL